MLKNNIIIKSKPVEGSLLALSKVSKKFGTQEIFSGVDMVVNKNDCIAIIGPNGTGKSTLIKIIIGELLCDDGSVQKNKVLSIGYLPQETHWSSLDNVILEEMMSADKLIFNLIIKKRNYENLMANAVGADLEKKVVEYGEIVSDYEANDGYEYEELAEEILQKFNFLDSEWNRKIKSLSGGEKTRLALAKIALQKPNLLVLDEPTNHLDLETISWLENFLSNWDGAIIAVSHDKRFLDLVCDKTYELQSGGLEKYYCNYSGYLEEREEREQRKKEEYKRQEKYLKEQNEWIERFRYKPTKARAVQSRIKMLDKLEKVQEPKENKKKVKIRFNISKRLPQKVLQFKNLFVGGEEFPLAVFEDDWIVEKKSKIGIIGPNGAGKSTFLKALVEGNNVGDERLHGARHHLEGEIKFSSGVKIGYYAQAHEELDPQKNILEEVESKVRKGQEKIRTVLGALLFSGEDVFKNISDLSGGERARVAIAELILSDSNMLLLDEPTNHLDLESKDAMNEVLKSFNGPIMIVSHDRSVLFEVCNVIWEIKDNEVKEYLGNYDDYEERK
ncbi:MAG: ABC-F family ATP-binding cassette domain-containing protein [Patescibacteria group bacterium]|nr:ABC-F family ATP-binding cassette domain-containing protein [Patescibacteria group bacterium]